MCVIIAKNKNDRLPSKKELKKCFEHNPDGAGFMYTDNNRVIIDKGYMTYEAFINRYHELVKKYDKFEDKCLVIHCRIGTGGGNNPHNTHGYPLTNKISEMQKLHNKCDIGLMHNGIIRDYEPKENWYNDTQEFIKEFVFNLLKFDKHFYRRQYFRDMIKDNSSSKWAILDKEDNLYTCGSFDSVDGLKFSNLNHDWEARYNYNYGYSSTGTSKVWNWNNKRTEDTNYVKQLGWYDD